MNPMLEVSPKDFKAVIRDIFKDLKRRDSYNNCKVGNFSK